MADRRRLLPLILAVAGTGLAAATLALVTLAGLGGWPVLRSGMVVFVLVLMGTLAVVIVVASLLTIRLARPVLRDARESEDRYRGLFGNMGTGVAVYRAVDDGRDFVFLDLNRAGEASEGLSREDVVGRRLTAVYPRVREFGLPDVLERVWRTGVAESLAPALYRDETREGWRENHVYRLPNGDIVALFWDMSERKRAEAGMRESDLRIRALLDASRDEILLVSTTGTVLAINKAARARLERRCAGREPVGANLAEVLPEEHAEHRLVIVRRVAATNTLAHYDLQIRARWFDFWFYPVPRPDGQVSEVAVYAREVTEMRQAEADRRKLFQAIEQSPVSVVITDTQGSIEYVNPKFVEATGYPLDEVIGRNPRILKSGHTPAEEYALLWRTIRAGGIWHGEFHNRRKNGELFWEQASIGAVRDAEDRITHFVGVKEDITERKEIEEQLRQSQKMQALGQLTGGIAHDFNNLLAIIIGNLQLLAERSGGDLKIRELLDDAVWSAERGAELTHRLLAFARRQPLNPDTLDLNAVIGGLSALLRRTLGGGIEIREMPAEDLWPAYVDRGELERAVVNLAVNARDAMDGTGVLTLETRNATLDESYAEGHVEVAPGEYVLFAVSDTGAGMQPEVIERVFEPFFTTKDIGKGSGLGLSMVYGFIKQSGGHVSIYSRPGQGTCVKLYLPRFRAAAAKREETVAAVVRNELRNRSVLLVEDEPKLRKVAAKMLDRLGLSIMQAENAEEALEVLRKRRVDILFTDIELPGGMNGAQLATIAETMAPDIKVLFTTGYAGDSALDGHTGKDRAWLPKPYSQRDLARELAALLA